MREEVELDGRKIVLVGTAHVSQESVKEVEEAIEKYQPGKVAVELDEKRLKALRNPDAWENMDVFHAISEGQGYRLLFKFLLSIYQRKLGKELDITPGREMLEAVEAAEEREIDTALIDRDINITLKRAMDGLSVREKAFIAVSILEGFFYDEEIDVEELKDRDILHEVISEFAGRFPSLKKALIDERDSYMAERIMEAEEETVLAVVGAGHVEGIKRTLEQSEKTPGPDKPVENNRKFSILKTVKYGLPIAILALFLYSALYIGPGAAGTMFKYWFIMNGSMAALGALISLAHPLTILVSFIAAPFTSVNPALPAGLVAAYTENYVRSPRVEDLEGLGRIDTYTALWRNRATKILLIFFLVNLGSSIATFLGTGVLVWLAGIFS
ncbi:MAG: TraB/GumN family protein [Candidatus Nanohaloarchaea archaeon]|nr:TraB/GumN family protein [Candidatus Nanohaloarchaea archaeon]